MTSKKLDSLLPLREMTIRWRAVDALSCLAERAPTSIFCRTSTTKAGVFRGTFTSFIGHDCWFSAQGGTGVLVGSCNDSPLVHKAREVERLVRRHLQRLRRRHAIPMPVVVPRSMGWTFAFVWLTDRWELVPPITPKEADGLSEINRVLASQFSPFEYILEQWGNRSLAKIADAILSMQ